MKTFDDELVKDRVNRFPFVKMMGMKLVSCSGGTSVMRCRVRQGRDSPGIMVAATGRSKRKTKPVLKGES